MPPASSWPPARVRPVLWTGVVMLISVEVLSLYLLCAYQVHRAEVRVHVLQMQAQAFSDCLTYVTGSTIASCGQYRVAQR